MLNKKPITKNEAIVQIAAQLDGPIAFDEFTERVLALWHSNAKRPQAGVRQTVRDDHLGRRLLLLDKQTLIPIHLAMAGVCFRVPLAREEVKKGWFFVNPAFQYMMHDDVTVEMIQFVDTDDHAIPADIKTFTTKQKSIFGTHDIKRAVFELGWWYKKQKVRRNDNLLVTILDWESGKFRLQHESGREYRKYKTEIQVRNQELANAMFDTLEEARYEYIRGAVAIPTVYAQLKDTEAYPTDHWLDVIKRDSRMHWSGYEIRYAGEFSPIENLVAEFSEEKRPSPQSSTKVSSDAKQLVYRFKAHLKYRKGLWRRIEIQGGQTLADFNDILLSAFEHDFDHMGGFWKLVRRGNSRRFREVDLGSVNPFGEGKGADVMIAAIGLKPGETMKYVYDFGDWIEHRIELEEVVKLKADAKYPRVVAQNRPRYRYCRHCKEADRKTVAIWICIHCSDDEQEEVWVCDDCASEYHEDHYMDEILY
ncbi:MAG: hypothetical protein GY803_08380 [Chloroflexi bacterium]|nr:hypothetical protein [Chloroflexota bacterium]